MVYWHKITDIFTTCGAGFLPVGAAHRLVTCPRQGPLFYPEMAISAGYTGAGYASTSCSGAG